MGVVPKSEILGGTPICPGPGQARDDFLSKNQRADAKRALGQMGVADTPICPRTGDYAHLSRSWTDGRTSQKLTFGDYAHLSRSWTDGRTPQNLAFGDYAHLSRSWTDGRSPQK